MSLKTRGLVFATFFGNCIIVGLLVASLTTDYWILARAKHHTVEKNTTAEADGRINFGLFSGYQNLNVGYGPRPSTIDVLSFIRTETNAMSYWLWLGATLGVGFATLASTLGAIASVLKSASFGKKRGTMVILFISNIASGISQMLAFLCWLVQFYQYLTHNVLMAADRKKQWYSTGMSTMGHSFYFVVIGSAIALVNVVLLIKAVSLERKERQKMHDDPNYDEVAKGAIMLY